MQNLLNNHTMNYRNENDKSQRRNYLRSVLINTFVKYKSVNLWKKGLFLETIS
jgi:hypothetical protein